MPAHLRRKRAAEEAAVKLKKEATPPAKVQEKPTPPKTPAKVVSSKPKRSPRKKKVD